jgi:hypothetical protein
MKLSRGLGLLAALGICWSSAIGCDDGGNAPADDNDASSAAGAGGSAGKGTGGSAGKGTGGSSGSSAAPGAGGSGGVLPGSGGGAGKGGAGGSSPGTGGRGTGGAGTADASADSGALDASATPDGSTPGTAEAGLDGSSTPGTKSCTYSCQTDDDCLVDGDPAMKCHPTKKRCFDPTTTCQSNDDCVGFVSVWFPSCAGDDDCLLAGDVCVDAGGYGLCATPPDPVDGCFFPGQVPLTRKRFGAADGGAGDAGTIAVCGDTSGRCAKGQCITGCSSDPEFCTNPGDFGSTCNEVSGMCECAASTECTASGVSACNQQNHLCECASNADCTSPGLDTCVAGSCGCSSASACPTSPYKNAVSVCD